MSKLQELIEKLCPDGVEYKTIGNLASYRRGSFPQPYTNSSFYGGEGAMPFVQVADIENEGFKLKDKTKQTISKIAQPKSIFVHKGTVICSIQGTIGRVAITQYDSYIDRTIAIFEKLNEEIDKKYFAYCIDVKFGIEKQFARGSTLKTITKEEFTKFYIPVPPLEVQYEIVNILDNFTRTSATLLENLSFELEKRKKQFEFYRNKLFEEVKEKSEIMKIQDISKNISSGGTPLTSVSEYYNGEIPWLRTQEVDFDEIWDTEIKITDLALKNSSAKVIPANCVIVAMYGATVGKAGTNKIPLTTNQACCNIEVDETKVNYKYLFYWLSEKYEYIKSLGQGSQTNINSKIVKELEVPIPSLDKQKRIIDLLDKYSKITNDILEIIPNEIKLRKQQYEYYRNQLLSFRKVEI